MIGGQNRFHSFSIHPSVAMPYDFLGDIVGSGQPRRRSCGQMWQFPAVLLGQVPPYSSNLLFKYIKIIKKTFSCGGYLHAAPHILIQQAVDGQKHFFVVHKPWKQNFRLLFCRYSVSFCQQPAMLSKVLSAEQLKLIWPDLIGVLPGYLF